MDYFAVAPRLHDPVSFLGAFDRTIELADAHDFRGVLLFDGAQVPFSPWLLAQHMMARSSTLVPLIAAGPSYVSAKNAARFIANLHQVHGRSVALNLVAGAEARTGSHSERYQALQEFALTLEARLARLGVDGAAGGPPAVAARFVAGHSEDAASLAVRLGAANMRMLPSMLSPDLPAGCGFNLGVVARPTTQEAWAAAHDLFPHGSRASRVASRVAASTDSRWKAEVLSEAPAAPGFWRVPAQSLKADSPFYVGSYDEVAGLFAGLRGAAASAALLDLPPSEAEYAHVSRAFELDALGHPVDAAPLRV